MKRGLLIAALVLAGVAIIVVATDVAISSPALCSSCHEMQHRASSWATSAHGEVACVRCHVEPHPWYEYPAAFLDRAALVARDINLHMQGGYDDPVDSRRPGTEPMPDEVCLQCHDPNRKATSGFRILIDHPEHAKRNGSCVSCHIRTAHPVESRGAALSLMAQCFTCHGQPEYPKASTKCDVCHPDSYELSPASHNTPTWKARHGKVATRDRSQCRMCHTAKFCTDCHGVEMPHPAGWEKGPTGHAVVAKTMRDTCTKCHTEKPDMCSMCHHKAYDPTKGNWVQQHFIQVDKEGTAFCMRCHQPTFCVRCHVRASMGIDVGQAPQ